MQSNFNIKTIISVILIVTLGFTLINIIGKVLTPFIIALILAYILNPLVENLNKKLHINRNIIAFIMSLLIFLLFIAIPLFVFPMFVEQIKIILTKAPDLISAINNNIIYKFNLKYGTHFRFDFENIRQIMLGDFSKVYKNIDLFSPIAKNSFLLIEIIVYTILIPFILFYTIKNWRDILKFCDGLIPRSYVATTHSIIKDIDTMMSAYMRGQLSVMLIMATYYASALFFIDLTSGIMIGIMTGLLVFVPYVGILTGFFLSICVAIAGSASMHGIIAILIVFMIGHILEGGLVTPFLVGGKIGLNPVMIILALMIFGKAFGIIGVLLALPLSTIAVVILKYARIYYINSKYYRD